MIYLIGGAPNTGKSTLANKLAKKLGAEVIELDLLMPQWNIGIGNEEWATKLPVWSAKKDGREPFTEDYRVEAETYWPSIQNLILEKSAQGSKDYVLEGAQLWPAKIKGLSLDNIQCVFLSGREMPAVDKELDSAIVNEAKRVYLPVASYSQALNFF